MAKKKYDFSGYATKADVKCSDGRIIRKDAFKHNDGQTVPLVWQHTYDDPSNILGHAVLENREDGVYAYCVFNDSEAGKNAKTLVNHGDITSLSIRANQLNQNGDNVLHGRIIEVSLVLAGANPGAMIDNLSIQHSDGTQTIDDSEAIIYSDGGISLTELEHAEKSSKGGKTVQDVFNTLNEEQKEVVYAMIGQAVDSMSQSATGDDDKEEKDDPDAKDEKLNHSNEGGTEMKKNVFEKKEETTQRATLTHDQLRTILADAQKCGSLKESFLTHAGTYGIDNIDYLFPDARNITPTPELISRRMEWAKQFVDDVTHTPFSRIKSLAADITPDEARAKGYVTGALKKEEVFALLKRVTTPTTVYKKQKLDRDDIIDITDLDVVAWLKMEMRMMLDEELARTMLIGDGRDIASEDKVNELNIRPIYKDDDMYSHKVQLAADATTIEKIEAIIRARKYYKGTGRPTFYTTADQLTDMLLVKDSNGVRIYKSEAELASDLRVTKIVEVEVMENQTRTVEADTFDLLGIIVNPKDYKAGADKGGKVAMFDDFDIDYNQYKYLIETRMSGALVRPKAALVIEQIQAVG